MSGTAVGFFGKLPSHGDFLERMVSRGYTQRQVRRLVEWYMRVNKAG